MKSVFALTGIFQPPKFEGGYTAIPMLSDPSTQSLFIFLMFPGGYDDAYEIAANPMYANIFIVPVSLDVNYVSDVHRLITDLTRIKRVVKVLYPGKYPLPVDSVNELAIVRGDTNKATFTFNDGFIAFNYNGTTGCGCPCMNPIAAFFKNEAKNTIHDIYVRWNNKGYLLTSTFVDKARILGLFEQQLLDYVYVPYIRDTNIYHEAGRANYMVLVSDPEFAKYMNRVIAYGFTCIDDFMGCYLNHKKSTPMTYRRAFKENSLVTTTETYEPAIGNIAFCPSIFFPNITPTEYPEYENGTSVPEDEIHYIQKEFVGTAAPEGYEYKIVELSEGTAVITRNATDPSVLFEISFYGSMTQKYTDCITNELNNEVTDVSLTWDDVNLSYFTDDMKLVQIDSKTDSIAVTNSNTVRLAYFDKSLTTYSDLKLYECKTQQIFAAYLDLIEPVVEEDPIPPTTSAEDIVVTDDGTIDVI